MSPAETTDTPVVVRAGIARRSNGYRPGYGVPDARTTVGTTRRGTTRPAVGGDLVAVGVFEGHVARTVYRRTVDDVGDAGMDVAVGDELHEYATTRDRVGVAGDGRSMLPILWGANGRFRRRCWQT